MSECRNRCREFRRVVICADPRDQLAGHEAEARRRAERRVAIGGIEPHAAVCQRIDMGCLYNRVSIGTGELRGQLICHDQDDVGGAAAFGHGVVLCTSLTRKLWSYRNTCICTFSTAFWLSIPRDASCFVNFRNIIRQGDDHTGRQDHQHPDPLGERQQLA